MCGIAGLLDASGQGGALDKAASMMASALAHRGPDASGVWVDEAIGVALAHRRLSILELSTAGAQPMFSACERYVIVFNGEIYNHLELRRELDAAAPAFGLAHQGTGNEISREKSVTWRGHSDTETLLAAVAAWGLETALKRLVGMFAFALWDRRQRTLTLARDRIGEKPLYYGVQGRAFLFGSELKALRAHPQFHGEIDRDALTLFLRHGHVPAPYSIYKGIHKLLPGTYLRIAARQGRYSGGVGDPTVYWSAREVAEAGAREFFRGSEAEAERELARLLMQSTAGQMIADVPVGAFLSGGVDSSTVVALMQAQSARPVKTFTIGFHEKAYNEAEHAHAVAAHLGTEHTELYVTAEQAMAVIPRLPVLFDEPFADPSQIPTFLVSELARRHVTVSLSGDGGDELFGGYNRYVWATRIWRRAGWLPSGMRGAIAGVMTALPRSAWSAVFSSFARFLPSGWRYADSGDKLHKLADVLAVKTPEEIYSGLVSHWKPPMTVVVGGSEPSTVVSDTSRWPDLPEFADRMMYLDLVSYLPDDILTKVDRAAMGVSLETRMPMLDHRVVDFAWRLPSSMKIGKTMGKRLLRQVLYRHVPRELIERPKTGFDLPLDDWLRGPLRGWAEPLLDERRMVQEGFLNPEPIRKKWAEHLAGHRNWAHHLWIVLMFQAWLPVSGI